MKIYFQDPMTIQSLPKYACPDLTGKPGFWAKALAEKYAESNALIHFYFTSNGDVHYGVNGVDKGIFFSGLDTRYQGNIFNEQNCGSIFVFQVAIVVYDRSLWELYLDRDGGHETEP